LLERPFALRKLLIAGPIIEHAVEFLIEPRRVDGVWTAALETRR
jgi:hypothetical protein